MESPSSMNARMEHNCLCVDACAKMGSVKAFVGSLTEVGCSCSLPFEMDFR